MVRLLGLGDSASDTTVAVWMESPDDVGVELWMPEVVTVEVVKLPTCGGDDVRWDLRNEERIEVVAWLLDSAVDVVLIAAGVVSMPSPLVMCSSLSRFLLDLLALMAAPSCLISLSLRKSDWRRVFLYV